MKKIVFFVILLVFVQGFSQKVKFKKGKVFVDKKETLMYERTKTGIVYKTFDGKRLFKFKKESVEKDNPNKNVNTSGNRDSEIRNNIGSNQSDPIRRGDRYTKKQKVNFTVVSFYDFKLEYETTLSPSKIIREFYKSQVINDSGLIIPVRARIVAQKMAKNLTGKRKIRP